MRYQHYAAKFMLPARRLQMQLAQAAMWSAKAAGAADVSMADFVFDPPDEVEDAAAFFEFKPRK